MPIAETIGKFVEIGAVSADTSPDIREAYLVAAEKRAAASAFWEAARERLWDAQDDEISCRLRVLGVVKEVGGDPLVGAASHEKILSFVEQLGRQPPVTLLPRPGIIFPYQTIPGVYSGFLVVQYENTNSRQIFIPTTHERRRPEAGYFLLQTALQPRTKVLRDTQFIVADPFWALRQQYIQRRYGLPMLPVMAAYYGNEAKSYGKNWRAFHSARRIFHNSAHTPEVISCACNAGGYVAVSNSLQSKPHRSNPTLTALAHIKKRAGTWRAALAEAIAPMSELGAYSFFTKLTIPAEKTAAFLTACRTQFSQNFADKVLAAITQKRLASPARQDKYAVIERDGTWITPAGRQVCNGLVKITKVIYTDKNEKFYTCRASCKTNTIEFTDRATKIESTGLLEYAAKKFAEIGVLFVYDRRWNLKANSRAMAMHEPQILYSVSELGWNESAQLFHFGGYDLDAGGALRESVLLPNAQIDQSFPEPLLALPPPAYKFLTPAYDNSFNWLAFSAFVGDVLAPVLNELPTAATTTEAGFGAAAAMWQALGAEMLELTYAHSNHTNDRVREKTKAINWPLCAANIFDDSLASYSVLHCHNRSLLLRLNRPAASAAAGYGWLVLHAPQMAPKYDFSVFQYILPMYIQHVLKNRFRAAAGQPLALAVLRDVHDWLKTNTGATFNLTWAENSVFTQKTAHIALAKEIGAAIDDGIFDILPRPRRKDQPKNYLLQQKTTWWLNRRAIDSYFKNRRCIPPNWNEIVNLLAENGATVEEVVIHGMLGYSVDRAWCDANIIGDTTYKKTMGG